MNEKISCGIIEDLIPLYKENLCSDESRALVEEHIAECESCRALAESIEPPKVAELSDADEQKPFRKVNNRLKRSRLKVIILSVLLAVIVFPLAFLTAGQMFRWNGAISFETIIQNFEAQRIADAFANGDIDIFSDYILYYSFSAGTSFFDNRDQIEKNDKQTLKELYKKCFTDDYVLTDRRVHTTYEHGTGDVTSYMWFQYYSGEKDKWLGIGFEFTQIEPDYHRYYAAVTSMSYTPDEDDTAPDDYEDFVNFINFTSKHDIDEYNNIETFLNLEDPLGKYDTGGTTSIKNDDGTYTEVPDIYDPAITYLGQYFVPEDRDHIIQSMVAFFKKGYSVVKCTTVSNPCYEPDRGMMYYNIALTAADSSGLAVLQARMFYDYRGIYQPEVYSVAPNGCSAELINDIQHFFGYELDTPVLSSKLHDLTDAKKLLDDNGIRCKTVTGTNVVTGEHDSELLTSFEDAAAASGVLLDIYGSNEEYECYIY